MDVQKAKRKKHLPQVIPQKNLPHSRCSGNKFMSVISNLSQEKKDIITNMGFGGLLRLACREIRYELCMYLISNYDIPYHRIKMVRSEPVRILIKDVQAIMGIPCEGVEINVPQRRNPPPGNYSLVMLEERVRTLNGEEFMKAFLVFTCATLLAPNSMLEGQRDLWEMIYANDVHVKRNWGAYMLSYLEDGIRRYQQKPGAYVRGCLLFLQLLYVSKTYLPDIQVQLSPPICAIWTDELIKQRLSVEISHYKDYGYVDVQELATPQTPDGVVHNDPATPPASPSHVAPDTPPEIIAQRMVSYTEQMMVLFSKYKKDELRLRETLRPCTDTFVAHGDQHNNTTSREATCSNPGPSVNRTVQTPMGEWNTTTPGVCSHPTTVGSPQAANTFVPSDPASFPPAMIIPNVPKMARYYQRRSVKPSTACRSPFVQQCITRHQHISHIEHLVADYAFMDKEDKSEILSNMYGTYLTREELACMKEDGLVNSSLIRMYSRYLNNNRGERRTSYFFDPSFHMAMSTIRDRTSRKKLIELSHSYVDPSKIGCNLHNFDKFFIPVCHRNHWHLHVVNFGRRRVELLSSLPFTRALGGVEIPSMCTRLSESFIRILHAFNIYKPFKVSDLQHVIINVPQQTNYYDCGVYVLKYMEGWDGSCIQTSIVNTDVNLYRLMLTCTMIMTADNSEWDRISHDLGIAI